ncbi:MAG TPA: TetR/AcrR family transcriptional regulator C-terminal domain-containing protein [Trebonia sp.]|nr:TetR/AcrR family transcriptional regulator C-terminal domain-containing protein [Trebonia sp.]
MAAKQQARVRRARGSISAEQVLKGAFEVCAEGSVDRLTMPRLAEHLGVGVTSLYWYYKSKDELLDAMSVTAFKAFYERIPRLRDGSWEDILRDYFTNFRRALLADDLLCDLVIIRVHFMGDRSYALSWSRIEEILRSLVDAGFSEEAAINMYSALSIYTRGAIFIERSRIAAGMPDGFMTTGHNERPDPVTMPLLSKRYQLSTEQTVEAEFTFGLNSLIDGFRPLLAHSEPATSCAS